MNEQYTTYCGLECNGCEYKESAGCTGCVASGGEPFHGVCPVAKCCISRGHGHCGRCEEYVCDRLCLYSYDTEHGDSGKRIEALNKRLSAETDLQGHIAERVSFAAKASANMDKASRWMKAKARKLEASLWRFYFEGGSREEVLIELVRYQNSDGGFGNGLEADFWLPDSSAIATNEALKIMHSVGTGPDHPMVSKTMDYLMNSRIPGKNIWLQTPPAVNDYPHAFWWNHDPKWEEGVHYNPAVSLLSYMYGYAVSDEERQFVRDELPRVIQHLFDESEIGFEYLSCCRVLYSLAASLIDELGFDSNKVRERLIELTVKDTCTDPGSWNSYCPQPAGFLGPVDGPCSIYYPHLKEASALHLRYLIETADGDGLWTPPWNWGQYPEEFKVASEYWKGTIAISNYRALKQFGYV